MLANHLLCGLTDDEIDIIIMQELSAAAQIG